MNNRKQMNGYQMLSMLFLFISLISTGYMKDGPVTETDLAPMGLIQMGVMIGSAVLSLFFWIVSIPEVRVKFRRMRRPSEPVKEKTLVVLRFK